jgi:hypothetical protein
MASPPADAPRCEAVTQARPDRGQPSRQCSRAALPGSRLCGVHGKPKAPKPPSPPRVPTAATPARPPAKSNGWAQEQPQARAAEIAKAEAEEHDLEERRDASTITAAINASTRIRRDTTRLSDYRLLGAGLLTLRRQSMQAVGATKPRGLRYVKT